MQSRRADAPLIVTAAFVVLVALLTTGVLPSPIVVAEVQCSGEYAPPNLGYDDCKRTQTAEAASPTATSASSGGGGGSQSAPTLTPTPTVTRTPTATAPAVTGTPLPSATPVATRPPSQGAVAPPTPTAALPTGVPALVCLPGTTVTLAGQAAPRTQLLAFFGDRPVGGGFSLADGSYSIDLLIGQERPGLYLVEVRERDGLTVISQVGCEIPGDTGTPTPTLEIRGREGARA